MLNVECSSIAKHDFWFARSGKREKRLPSGTNIAMSKMVFGFPTRQSANIDLRVTKNAQSSRIVWHWTKTDISNSSRKAPGTS